MKADGELQLKELPDTVLGRTNVGDGNSKRMEQGYRGLCVDGIQ